MLLLPDQQAAAQTASPHALALPRSVFPSGAAVTGRSASNGMADAASMLHAAASSDVGRVGGYLQRAAWMAAARRRNENRTITTQYLASIYPTVATSTATVADARASLWEVGRPDRIPTVDAPVFTVQERDEHISSYVLLQQGTLEAELRLRYGNSLDPQSVRWAQWIFGRVVHYARNALARYPQPVPTGAPSAQGSGEPPAYVAPWGTGPVVKSPSLMSVGTTDTSLDTGAFRTGSAPLAPRARPVADLVPPNALSRFVRTGDASPNAGLYNAVTLFASEADAESAWARVQRLNDARGLNSVSVTPPTGSSTDTWAAWRGAHETVVVVRTQNVLMVLAATGRQPGDLVTLLHGAVARVPTPLHAQGTTIVDASGAPFRLGFLNWYGAESPDFVVGGLDFRTYRSILDTMAGQGFNGIRLPFSNQLVEQNPVVTAHLAANPDLVGLRAMDIMDRVIAYAGALGLRVVLDNHRSDAGWSSQESGLWYTPQYPDVAWVNDWSTIAKHYAVNNVVVGADLRNEPHGPTTWGDGNPQTDWHLAAERAGDAVLGVNPTLLIMVEGIQSYAGSESYWWGGNLMGVATAPVQLRMPDGTDAHQQLVYSPHDYGPDNCHGGCPWFNATTTYDSLAATWTRFWGYIVANPQQPYAAPIWLGEFGTCNFSQVCVSDPTPGSQGQWFQSLIHFIHDQQLSWAYWSLNGTQSSGPTRSYGALEFYGALSQNWADPIVWIQAALASIQGGSAGPQ